MRLSANVKPISQLRAKAAEILEALREQREPVLITQNGEAAAVLQDVASYESTQETLALLKLLALGNRDIEEGRTVEAREAIARLRGRLAGER